MNKILILLLALISSTMPLTFAQELSNTRNDLHIIPESTMNQDELKKNVDNIWTINGDRKTVIDKYNNLATELEKKGDLGAAFASGVFNRNIVINYLAYLMRFLAQLGLLIGAIMVLYAGYLYATVIFGTGNPSTAKSAIENAIKWILVIIFSYAIRKLLVSMFIS